jgi:hypothetical protein
VLEDEPLKSPEHSKRTKAQPKKVQVSQSFGLGVKFNVLPETETDQTFAVGMYCRGR